MASDLAGKAVVFLGAGKMGAIILQALLKNGSLAPKSTRATVAHEETAKSLAAKLKVRVGTDNAEAVKGADIIVIGVKPQDHGRSRTRDRLSHHAEATDCFSGCIGAHFHDREKLQPNVPVIHAMPNTPCQQGAGMTAICRRQARQHGRCGYDLPHVRCGGTNRGGRRETHGRSHGGFGKRSRIHLYHYRIAGGGGSESGGCRDIATLLAGADHDGRCPRGARDRRPSGIAEGCGYCAGGFRRRPRSWNWRKGDCGSP